MADLKRIAAGLAGVMREHGYEEDKFDDATTVKVALIIFARHLGYLECMLTTGAEEPEVEGEKFPDRPFPEAGVSCIEADQAQADARAIVPLLAGVIGREDAVGILTCLNMVQEALSVVDVDVDELDSDDRRQIHEQLCLAAEDSSYHLRFYEARLRAIATVDFPNAEIPTSTQWSEPATMPKWLKRFHRSERTLRDWRQNGRLRMRRDPSGRGWQVHNEDLPEDSS